MGMSSTDDMSDFMERYTKARLRYAELVKEAVIENKIAIASAMKEAAIQRIVVDYNGCGDDGAIESVEAESDSNSVPLPTTSLLVHTIARKSWPSESS